MTRNDVYDNDAERYSGSIDIRERLASTGTPSVADFELVAAVLGTGSRGKDVRALAAEVLAACDFSSGVPSVAELSAVPGLGQARACRLAAALELGKRYYGVRERRIRSPEDAWLLVRHFDDRKQERFICCTLNGAHDVIAVRVVTVGLVNRTVVHPREVFADAIADRAASVLVAHNHPSGRLEPSAEDRDITERLKRAGEVLGIPVLDHLVFSQEGFVSLVEAGSLSPPKA